VGKGFQSVCHRLHVGLQVITTIMGPGRADACPKHGFSSAILYQGPFHTSAFNTYPHPSSNKGKVNLQ